MATKLNKQVPDALNMDSGASAVSQQPENCCSQQDHSVEEHDCRCRKEHLADHHGHECCGHDHGERSHCCTLHHDEHDHEQHYCTGPDHEEHDRCCGHHHDHKEDSRCCEHHHEHDEDHDHCCGHHHESEGLCCEHHHTHGEEHHHHEHDHHHCCCGHDHVENTMDTVWDIADQKQEDQNKITALLSTVAGVKHFEIDKNRLTITHNCDALSAIERALADSPYGVKRMSSDGMTSTEIRIMQMDCPTEEGLIRQKLKSVDGVGELQFNLMNRVLTVKHNAGKLPEIVEAIKSLDYTPEVLEGNQKKKVSEFVPTVIPWWKYGIGFALAVCSEAVHHLALPEWISLVFAIAAILTVGLGTYKKGFIAFANLNFNMNALMSVAVTGAALIGYWSEGAMVMVLFELSEAIEQLSLDRARGAIRSLLSLSPKNASVQSSDGQFHEVKADDVKVGDIVKTMPGERLVVDGIVTSGHSSVDQSALTGESIPVDKSAGDQVFAGTLNKNGELIYKATSTAEDSMPSRIINAIENAQSARAPTQRFVDQFAKIYTPTVFAIALLVGIVPPLLFQAPWFEWVYKALTLLVIACPCALVISTPVTLVSGLATAARRGILIKGGVYLEKGRKIKTIALDKTGTLTKGQPEVLFCEIANAGKTQNDLLKIAASLANRNDHPASTAVAAFAQLKGIEKSSLLPVENFKADPGHGVFGTIEGKNYYLGNLRGFSNAVKDARLEEIAEKGYSPLILASEEAILVYFGIADEVKSTSKSALEQMHALGVKTVMLTGDNEKTAQSIGNSLGIKETKANLLPVDKQNYVSELAQQSTVGMVGDGINDAPALARADIGFAMGAAGTDTAIETADVALMDDDLRKLPEFIKLSRKTFEILCQNITIALTIKVAFFILTMIGIGTMWMAVFADTGTCLIVVANGLRLLRWKG